MESNVDFHSIAQELSEEKYINKWSKDHASDILAKNVVAFGPCLKNLPENKLNEEFWISDIGRGNSKAA